MTLSTFPFNGTSGATATTGNTGGISFATGAGSTQTLQSGAAYQGSTGLRCISDGSAFSAVRHQFAGGANPTQATFSIRVKIPASLPSASVTLFQINDTAPARVLQLQYSPSGLLRINDKNNTLTQLLTAAQATAGSWFRVQITVSNLSTTAGAWSAKVYSGPTTQVGSTVSVSNANTGTVALDGTYTGVVTTGVAATIDVDSLRFNDGSTADIPEYAPNTTPPTIDSIIGSQTVTPAATVSLQATASAKNGDSIASVAWTIISALDPLGNTITGLSISNSSTLNASIGIPANTFGRVLVGLVVADSSGNTSAQSVVKIFSPTATAGLIAVTASSGFASAPIAGINDNSDTTFAESGAPGSESFATYRVAPLTPAASSLSINVHSMVQAAGGTQRVELLEGSTVRATATITPSTSFGDAAVTINDSSVLSSIQNWNELDLRFTQV